MNGYVTGSVWIKAKYPCKCAECGHKWRIGEEILFIPRDKIAYCEECGNKFSSPYSKIVGGGRY